MGRNSLHCGYLRLIVKTCENCRAYPPKELGRHDVLATAGVLACHRSRISPWVAQNSRPLESLRPRATTLKSPAPPPGTSSALEATSPTLRRSNSALSGKSTLTARSLRPAQSHFFNFFSKKGLWKTIMTVVRMTRRAAWKKQLSG